MYTDEQVRNIAKVFGALSNPKRLQILLMLLETERPLHIKAVSRRLKLDYGGVYRHVKVLEKAHLLEVYEVGRSRVLSPIHADFLERSMKQAREITIK